MTLLRGRAADAALRLLPDATQRHVQLVAKLLQCSVHTALRALVHRHHGDVDAHRTHVVERLVGDARAGTLHRGPGMRTWQDMVAGKDDAWAAETVVEGLLIVQDTPFATYRDDVRQLLGREADLDARLRCKQRAE